VLPRSYLSIAFALAFGSRASDVPCFHKLDLGHF